MLTRVNLQQTNLSNAELMGANLAGLNLQQANLAGANLQQANLTETNLNLANLTNACLFDAILGQADKKLAADNGVLFSKESFQRLKNLRSQQPFLNTFQITTNPDNNWSKLPAFGVIESSEGTILPVGLYDDADDETVFGNNSIDDSNAY
ncbi:MAG: pentapeptide repeat-containing protein [Nostoc sp.]|uniref:pentapeptide repeat-containing protein n=1 Tax=Nostoc sp. TaxID=1180 RepID=UPI002FF70DA9